MLRPTAIRVTPLENYFLEIIFDNGEKKYFDVKPYINGEWYGELNDPDYFGSVNVDGFTVVWPHGQDLCPDELYELSVVSLEPGNDLQRMLLCANKNDDKRLT